jgi:hypothetical protein
MSSCAACACGAAPRANSFFQDVLGGCGLAGLWGGAPRANSTITAYGVRLFRDIRRSFGVSEESFLASLGIKQVSLLVLPAHLLKLDTFVSVYVSEA